MTDLIPCVFLTSVPIIRSPETGFLQHVQLGQHPHIQRVLPKRRVIPLILQHHIIHLKNTVSSISGLFIGQNTQITHTCTLTFLWISSNISGVGSSLLSFWASLVTDASSTCTLGEAWLEKEPVNHHFISSLAMIYIVFPPCTICGKPQFVFVWSLRTGKSESFHLLRQILVVDAHRSSSQQPFGCLGALLFSIPLAAL